MPPLDKDTIARRVEALRLARADSAMEGLRTLPKDAAALDAFARGEIGEGEFMRRVSIESKPSATKPPRRRA